MIRLARTTNLSRSSLVGPLHFCALPSTRRTGGLEVKVLDDFSKRNNASGMICLRSAHGLVVELIALPRGALRAVFRDSRWGLTQPALQVGVSARLPWRATQRQHANRNCGYRCLPIRIAAGGTAESVRQDKFVVSQGSLAL